MASTSNDTICGRTKLLVEWLNFQWLNKRVGGCLLPESHLIVIMVLMLINFLSSSNRSGFYNVSDSIDYYKI